VRDWVVANYAQPSEYASKLRNLSLTDDDYAYEREYNLDLLTCSRHTKHTQETIARFAATSPGKSDRISHFHRLDLDGLCITLRAGTASNRGAFTSPRPIHPITPRCITVREAARLHSYPDWFRFHATKWHGFRQIGNSVPPLLAKAVAKEIIRILEITPIKPQQKYQLNQTELLQFKMSEAEKYHHLETRAIAKRIRR
jgi:DNA (cytosine-5)-methyltransferase 1